MIYDYNEAIKLFKNYHSFINALNKKKIFKIQKGIYSDNKNAHPFEIFAKKHKNVVFTMESALFFLGISDQVPTKYHIATDKDATKYKDKNIKQYFINNNLVNVGTITICQSGTKIKIYNKERMLLELVRYKNKLPYDYYKEVVQYYRNHIDDLDVHLIEEYLKVFPKRNFIENVINAEVF